MSAWAKPGVKCVCVGDDWDSEAYGHLTPSRVPMLNEVLTIKAIITPADYLPRVVSIAGGVGLVFEELPDAWFYTINHFRPLISRTQEQDLALFTPILDALPVGESA